VRQAKNELVRAEQSVSADILLLEANILFRAGQPVESWEITERLLSKSDKTSTAVKDKTHYLRGLISHQRGDSDQLRREIGALSTATGPGMRADRQELTGRLAMAESRWDAAVKALDETVRLRREKLDYAEMVQALVLAADACQRAGKHSAAATRYFRAGRSAAQQGNSQDAAQWFSSAARMADEAGDEALVQEVGAYLKRIQAP
jgi:tetratricopeptide (TPR) repeat protein